MELLVPVNPSLRRAVVASGVAEALSVQPADIVLIRGTGRLSRTILRLTGDTVSHAGLVLSSDPAIVIEALWRVKTRPLSDTIFGAEAVYILSDQSLTRDEKSLIIKTACSQSADGYGWWDLLLQVGDMATHSSWLTDKLGWALDKHPICSYLVAKAYGATGRKFGKEATGVTPSDILSFASAHPEKYSIKKFSFKANL